MSVSAQSDFFEKPAQAAGSNLMPLPEIEVEAKPQRRRFSNAYKLKIVHLADQCRNHGDLGSMLRREGLYSSHLNQWRKLRDLGLLQPPGSASPSSPSHPHPHPQGNLPSSSTSPPFQSDFSTNPSPLVFLPQGNSLPSDQLLELHHQNQLLIQRNRQLQAIVEVQKKLSEAFAQILTPISLTLPTANVSATQSGSLLPASV